MVKKVISESSAEQIDMKEVVSHIDAASGLLAHAAQSFADAGAIFEAIQAAADGGSLISRLAQLGINNCAAHDSDFIEYRDDYNAHAERYSAALPNNPLRRFRNNEDSSQGAT